MRKIQLSIPEPCHESWEQMTPTQQGRFCNACTKEVIDFSTMSDAEVLGYFSRLKNETVCGRAYTDQLNRQLSAASNTKTQWYWKYAAAFFLFIGRTNQVKSQGVMIPVSSATVADNATEKNNQKQLISGVVVDEAGNPVAFASIMLAGSHTGVGADSAGNFSIAVTRRNSMAEVSALGFETKTVFLTQTGSQHIVLTKNFILLDDVVVNGYGTRMGVTRVSGMMIVARCEKVYRSKDSLNKWFNFFKPAMRVFPNPAQKGAAVTIAFRVKEPGAYRVVVTDAAGRIISTLSKMTATKELTAVIPVAGSWSAGIYYISILDEKGNLKATANVAVQ